MAKIVLTTAPSELPVTPEEAREWCGFLDDDSQDALLRRLIVGATEHAEAIAWSRFVTQTWTQYWDGFASPLVVAYPPLSSVTSLKYLDTNGTEQTVATTVYEVAVGTGANKGVGIIRLKYGQTWPTPLDHSDVVYATFVCGYGAASSVPQAIKQAILLHVAHAFMHREGESPTPDAFFLKLLPYSFRRSMPVAS